ncbi:MAG: proton-translocating transhydrogenase family protein [Hyphomicrobiales bacterium]
MEQDLLTPDEAAERARDAAEQAGHAAEQAQAYADQARLAAETLAEGTGAATGIDPFMFRLAVFVLAIFVGYYVVWSVTPSLHTPLMSVTNAISSVIVVGALLAVGAGAMASGSTVALVLGAIALTLASVNIFGGFLVTQRMLGMYRKKG